MENKDKLNNNETMKKIIDKYKDELNTKNYNDVIFTLNKDLIHSRDKLSNLGIFICVPFESKSKSNGPSNLLARNKKKFSVFS